MLGVPKDDARATNGDRKLIQYLLLALSAIFCGEELPPALWDLQMETREEHRYEKWRNLEIELSGCAWYDPIDPGTMLCTSLGWPLQPDCGVWIEYDVGPQRWLDYIETECGGPPVLITGTWEVIAFGEVKFSQRTR